MVRKEEMPGAHCGEFTPNGTHPRNTAKGSPRRSSSGKDTRPEAWVCRYSRTIHHASELDATIRQVRIPGPFVSSP